MKKLMMVLCLLVPISSFAQSSLSGGEGGGGGVSYGEPKTSAEEIYDDLKVEAKQTPFTELPEFIQYIKKAGKLTCVKEVSSNFTSKIKKFECSISFTYKNLIGSDLEIYNALNVPAKQTAFEELPEFIEYTKSSGNLTCSKKVSSDTRSPRSRYSCSLSF
jgi:hypothetical protein